MFWLRNKKINSQLCTLIWRPVAFLRFIGPANEKISLKFDIFLSLGQCICREYLARGFF